MRRSRSVTIALLLAIASAPAACAEGGAERTAAEPAGAATRFAADVPAVLVGTWETTIRFSQFVTPPDGLRKGPSVWKLKVLGTGGKENGPSMFLSSDQLGGELVNPVALSNGQITLQVPVECQVYAYAVEGERMTLSAVDDGCPRDSLGSILTARPWRRTPRS